MDDSSGFEVDDFGVRVPPGGVANLSAGGRIDHPLSSFFCERRDARGVPLSEMSVEHGNTV
jgi:hypothetical protein